MKAVKIKENIYWVGAIDWKLRNFHGYVTQRGATYNAFLIIDEKITLIDTVKSYCYDEMLERISSVVSPDKIDYIISNHVESDHSGAIKKLLTIAKNAKVITSLPGQKGLTAYYGDLPLQPVKSGEEICIGSRTLKFVATPMVHWPDNMVSLLLPDNILFSNDAFGQHITTSERFDDECKLGEVLHEAEKYYANIVQPFSLQVRKVLEILAGLKIEMIAPSHGVIWRSEINKILELYKKWSNNVADEKAVIIYDTMWKSTEEMSSAVASAFENKNIPFKLMDLQTNHISDIMTEVLSAKYIALGSPTLNNNILPTVGGFLSYLKGLVGLNHKFVAFGSYGWSGQSADIIYKELESMKIAPMLPAIKIVYKPTKEALKKITLDIENSL